jgi:hypothetical protein
MQNENTLNNFLAKSFSNGMDEVIIEELLNPSSIKPKVKQEQRKIIVSFTKEISRCYHECPYFGLDGGPSPTMICNHPSFSRYEGCIISHPDCDEGFPKACPLLPENY